MDPDLKKWSDFIGNVGVPVALLFSLVIAGFMLTPTLLKWWRASAKQAEMAADTLPKMERHLERMADGHDATTKIVETFRAEANSKLDRLLDRENR